MVSTLSWTERGDGHEVERSSHTATQSYWAVSNLQRGQEEQKAIKAQKDYEKER